MKRQVTLAILCLAALLLAGCQTLHMAGYGCGQVVATRESPGGMEGLVVQVTFFDLKGKTTTDVLYVLPNDHRSKVGDNVTLLMWAEKDVAGRVAMTEIAKDSILCEARP